MGGGAPEHRAPGGGRVQSIDKDGAENKKRPEIGPFSANLTYRGRV